MARREQVSAGKAERSDRPRPAWCSPARSYSWRQWGVGAWCGMVGLFGVEIFVLGSLGRQHEIGLAAVGPAVVVAGVYALPFRHRPYAPIRGARVIVRGLGLNIGWMLVALMLIASVAVPAEAHQLAMKGVMVCLQLLLFSAAIWTGIRLAQRYLPEATDPAP